LFRESNGAIASEKDDHLGFPGFQRDAKIAFQDNVGTEKLDLMRKTGTLEEIGEDNKNRTVSAAVAGAEAQAWSSRASPIWMHCHHSSTIVELQAHPPFICLL
jgi:hypothetical protein